MFPATQWTELARATLHGDDSGKAALEALCRMYWEPVRQVILLKGWERDEAADLAQAFFLFFMEQNVLHRADREKGRFRTFLQAVLSRWLVSEFRHRTAAKRGGRQVTLALDDLSDAEMPTLEGDTATTFDQHWARVVMANALARVQAECAAKHGDAGFMVMGIFLGAGGEALSYEEASSRMGLTLSVFRSEVLTWRRRLREHLRAEVRRTVCAPHEIDEEMDYLRSLLAAG
jgi:DNA-directed RNA polymerase specialized sigma24 family protein